MQPHGPTQSQESLLADVRRATRVAHAALDEALALSTETITFGRYEAFLLGTERVVRRIEPLVRPVAPAEGPLRTACIERDLARLGRATPACRAELPPERVPRAEAFGMAYVLEGSSLGGLVLADRVESALGLDEGDGTSFLRLRAKGTATAWRQFLADFEAFGASATPGERALCCESAKQLFREYAESFRHSGAIS